ncbi:MAG: hypothetical protein GYB55_14680 [Cytophagales bacterium]|uniref:hypothetical protein n=1 Tax=Cyclobacterium marinum TaxID=104 RepID=UPI0011EE963E|nr:hypothetical protein [Cyclobacterium marinum]MBI0401003.1 hypothetical protein [Cyclobacterium marinum]MBR9776187.1 hypothetical protein [Cytophagales bacterium]
MFAKEINRELLYKWNTRSSTLTMLIYVLYGVFYRLNLSVWYDYLIISISIYNLILIAVILYLSMVKRNLVDHLKKAILLGIFRMLINLVLLGLIVSNSH